MVCRHVPAQVAHGDEPLIAGDAGESWHGRLHRLLRSSAGTRHLQVLGAAPLHLAASTLQLLPGLGAGTLHLHLHTCLPLAQRLPLNLQSRTTAAAGRLVRGGPPVDGTTPVLLQLVTLPEPPAALVAGPQHLPPSVAREGGVRPASRGHVAPLNVALQGSLTAELLAAEAAAVDALSSAFLHVPVTARLAGEIGPALGAHLPPPGVHPRLVLLDLGLGGELLATDIAVGGGAVLVASVEVELLARLEGLVAEVAEHMLLSSCSCTSGSSPVHPLYRLRLKGNL